MKATQASEPVLADFLGGIKSIRPRIRRLILFGSRARALHRIDSDYDVLVVVPSKDPDLCDVLYESVMDVLLKHGRLVSLKIFDEHEFERLRKLGTPFMKHVLEEGKALE